MRLDSLDRDLHAEADKILDGGVRAILAKYGQPIMRGSYALGLMVWRDLDIHLIAPHVSLPAFLELGGKLGAHLAAVKMNVRDHRSGHTPALPAGLYWGIYLGDERAGAWKLDIWAFPSRAKDPAEARDRELAKRLRPEMRHLILTINSEVWQNLGYRRAFSSQDIYDAVIEAGVRTTAQFREYLTRQGSAL